MSARQYTKGKQKPVVNHPALIAGCVPPHDLDAEAAVLSAILLSRDALDRVLEILKAEHFYSDANGRVYEAMVTLAIAGTPIDIVSVASWLRDRERLAQIGGPTYLAQLADATPAVAHVDAHAKVVFEKWRIRSLIAVCQRVSAEGYGDYGESQKFIDGAEQDIYAIARTAKTSKVQLIRDVMAAAFTQIQQTAERGDKMSGIPTGYDKLDEKIAGLHEGDLLIIAARPGVGKTSLALNMGVNIAAPHDVAGYKQQASNIGVVVFSLEMPREQLAVRMVCSEGRVDVGRVRQGILQPDDWRRLTEAASFLSSIPLWIDDSPGLNILELRAKVRRIQAEFNRAATESEPERKVGAVIVDYLQLMSGTGSESSREQEISAISRGLKCLAKELKVPVIALSQLNRAVETRSTKDKRPQLSDLRECLVGTSVVVDAITGEEATMREIADGRRMTVYGLANNMRVATAAVAEAWSTGVKPVFKMRTATGRVVRATANHPFRTISGWTRLDELVPGVRIAVPRAVPQHAAPVATYTHDELRMLGYLISDGSYAKHRTVSYVKADPVLVNDVRRIAAERFGVEAKDKPCEGIAEQVELTAPQRGPGCNPLINWLKAIGIHGQIENHKRVPRDLFLCDNEALGIFLGALWAGDGCVVEKPKGGTALKFSSSSMGLLRDVHWILTRLGITSVSGNAYRTSKATKDLAEIIVSESDAIIRFGEVVAMPGVKGERLRAAVEYAKSCGRNARNDRLPLDVTNMVAAAKREAGMSWSELTYRCQGGEMCRADLARVGVKLGRADMIQLAESDILWDAVDSIVPDGEEETFDMRVPGLNNFVVDNVFAHNSGAIEQDADTICFLYRQHYYEPENDAVRGLAEVNVAKQRNGPTGKVMLKFTNSCTRFDNLAQSEYPQDADE